MSRRPVAARRLAHCLGAVLALSGLVSGAGRSPAGAAATVSVQVMPAMPVPTTWKSDGPLPRSTEVAVSVALSPAKPAALERYAENVSTPGNSRYRHFLTPAAVRARFGPTASTIRSVRSWLTSEGLGLGATEGDGTVVRASGTAAQIEQAFSTRLAKATMPVTGVSAFTNTRPASVPATLEAAVRSIVGLSTLSYPPPKAPAARSRSSLRVTAAKGQGPVTACRAATTHLAAKAYTPAQIAQAYSLTSLYGAGDEGQGSTIALFEGGAVWSNDDLRRFDRCFGITSPVVEMPLSGPDAPSTNPSLGLEVAGDIEVAQSFAPKAKILVYETADTMSGWLDGYAKIEQDDQAQTVSISWGQCEANAVSAGIVPAENAIFEGMAAQGQSVFAAAGDDGSEGCSGDAGPGGTNLFGLSADPDGLAVADPASQPFVTAVGGTESTSPTGPVDESTWNKVSVDGAAGGGASAVWPMAPWQVTKAASGLSNLTACSGAQCRQVPDVAALAGFGENCPTSTSTPCTRGYMELFAGTWTVFGGTSAATPVWAALAALAGTDVANHRLGLLTPALYTLPAGDFHDIADGSDNDALDDENDTCSYGGTVGPCYEAVPGYDLATGLGTPVGSSIVAALTSER